MHVAALDESLNEREALCIRLGAYTGLRGGEVGGLRLQDVDFEGCRFKIVQSTKNTSAGRSVSGTKTPSSRRTIQVARSLVEEIRAYIEEHPVRADGLIFRTAPGEIVTHYQLTQWTQRAARKAGMRPVSFHDLRHTCASLLIQAGAPAKTVSTYLGHSNASITVNMYQHLYGGEDGTVANAIESLRQAQLTKELPA